ncbi:putative nucleotidyltransferase [Nocardia kruczakiae]|uniref:Nucleotidyltransferase n=1 Tax=Nocardia kruczakiae TaxID=261477 RepID=A0ABU1XHZ1_9NOCA|nr:nucleotidyltransferase domain-containing protein [Nocardia kruczakiae]MDR7170165.1 putative nucleotidyltransferase [Nocardia kruczakiae]
MSILAAVEQACRIRGDYVGRQGYGLVYGSHATGTATPTSDLDLVLIGPEQLPAPRMSQLITEVCALHHRFGLDLDTEVAYETKLFATFDDVHNAVALRCFDRDDGIIRAVPVVAEPAFLNSHRFGSRLLLNALTSPHIFLGGNTTRYRVHQREAEAALARLALALVPDTVVSMADISRAVVCCASAAGKDFLGYDDGAHLRSTLARGMGELMAEGFVRDIDGTHIRKPTDRPQDS